MKKKQILVFDDDKGRTAQWAAELKRQKSIQKLFEVNALELDRFKEALSALDQRRRQARLDSIDIGNWRNPIDSAAILIIDYDLLELNREQYITGETVAYLARCYSKCGLIVGLNQYGDNDFDLTLKGHPESYADLNIGSKQLASIGLWHEPWSGFRPWTWPILPLALQAFERRAKSLAGCLDEPILTYLGFPDDVVKILPRSVAEFIEAGDRSSEKVTFRQFVEGSGNGLSGKDVVRNDKLIARIAAARIAKWLERLVLPGQDIIVDAPHLVSRYPSLLNGNARLISTWNKAASIGKENLVGIKHTRIKQFRFSAGDWLSRPGWFWKGLSNHQTIPEVANPWSIEKPGFVFCEDMSCFLPREAAREFVADLTSQYVRRFVVDPNTELGKRFAKETKPVLYKPIVRFSL